MHASSRPRPAQDYLVRSPHAAIVPIAGNLPPRDSPLWEKIRQSDYGRHPLAGITSSDVAAHRAAVSDSGFEAYRAALLGAFVNTNGRHSPDSGLNSNRGPAAPGAERGDLAQALSAEDDSAGRAPVARRQRRTARVRGHVHHTATAPRILSKPRSCSGGSSTIGDHVEMTTSRVIVAGLLVLALGGRANEAVVGTVSQGRARLRCRPRGAQADRCPSGAARRSLRQS